MIIIRPVSDLRNKYPEIEDLVYLHIIFQFENLKLQ